MADIFLGDIIRSWALRLIRDSAPEDFKNNNRLERVKTLIENTRLENLRAVSTFHKMELHYSVFSFIMALNRAEQLTKLWAQFPLNMSEYPDTFLFGTNNILYIYINEDQ
jgi:hypothetical protein